jgi:ligand-binding sensor domain-containing protein
MWRCMLILLLFPCVLQGQGELRISHQYSSQDGLSDAEVYALCEDSQGFLWIAARGGLNRFDGSRFVKWYHNKRDSTSLAHNSINDILEYRPGMLLIATANGLSVFNTHLGKFQNELISYPPLKAGHGANVSSLFMTPDSLIWVNYNGEIDLFSNVLKHQLAFTDQPWAKGLRGSVVLFEKWQTDSEGRIWLPTDTSGLQIIDLKSKIVYNRKYNPLRLPFMDFQHIRSFYLDNTNQVLYLAPWGSGLYRFDLQNKSTLHQDFGLPLAEESSVNAITRLDNGKLLCNADGRFYEVEPGNLDFRTIDVERGRSSHGSQNPIHTITMLRSAANRFWIGADEGLFQMETNRQQWDIAIDSISPKASCSDVLVAASGVYYALYDDYTLVAIDGIRKSVRYIDVPHEQGDFLTQMQEDRLHRIWIGTSRGVQLFDIPSGRFIALPEHLQRFTGQFIHSIFHDRDGVTWLATRQPFGLFTVNQESGEVQQIDNEPLRKMGAVSEYARISSLHEDQNGSIWMRSIVGGGIVQFDKRSNTWHHHPAEKVPLLSNSGLFALYPDDHQRLWFSTTVGDGLVSYDLKTKAIQQFNREDGVLSEYIPDIEYYNDKLYLTSAHGYNTFDLESQAMISTDWAHAIGDFVMAIDNDKGWMVLGDAGKVVIADLNSATSNATLPVPLIDGIFVNNKAVFIDARQSVLRLAPDKRNVAIAFTSPYFDDADKLTFAYQLEGADHDWQISRESRIAQYAALSPGTYRFQLKVADARGHWSEVVNALTFTIAPPFWQRPWFIGLAILALGLIIYFLLQRRFKALEYEANLKQKVAETEMMALRAQMNPHFIFNSINSIDALIMNDDKYQATMYLNKFAKLIRNILDSSKQNTVPIEKDIETLRLYIELEQLRSENAFTADIEVDPTLIERDIRVPPLIIQPYVENAILHGLKHRRDDQGKLSISIARSIDGIGYSIEDNGVGREAHVNGSKNGKTSYGMEMSSDRIKLFNQEEKADVRITDLMDRGRSTGTKVEITLKTT